MPLQHLLEEVGHQLETASFQLYSRHWERLEETLPALAAAVEAFVASVDRDMRHAAEVVATGCFSGATVTQLDATRVRVTYLAADRAAVERYVASFAPALRAKGLAAFPDGVTWSREIGTIVGHA